MSYIRDEHIKLLLCESRGIYIPRDFAECFDIKDWNLTEEDIEALSSPENEWYWEAWAQVLDKAQYTDNKGLVWYLYQEGDLFSVSQEFLDREEEI
jgi:hypothetical protein